MIKVNELRIGNWYIDEKGEYQNVGHIQNNFYGTLINGNNYFLFPEMINPIPLTPEILEKCGFANSRLNDFSFYTTVLAWRAHPFAHIKYLHQLQNLYFCLTGEELNIQL